MHFYLNEFMKLVYKHGEGHTMYVHNWVPLKADFPLAEFDDDPIFNRDEKDGYIKGAQTRFYCLPWIDNITIIKSTTLADLTFNHTVVFVCVPTLEGHLGINETSTKSN